jgi:hypothetical protein
LLSPSWRLIRSTSELGDCRGQSIRDIGGRGARPVGRRTIGHRSPGPVPLDVRISGGHDGHVLPSRKAGHPTMSGGRLDQLPILCQVDRKLAYPSGACRQT